MQNLNNDLGRIVPQNAQCCKLLQTKVIKNTTANTEDSSSIPAFSDQSTEVNQCYLKDNRLMKLGLTPQKITKNQLIDGKYIPSALLHSLIEKSGKSVVLLGAGLGLGKSTASAKMMTDYYGGLGVAVSHRVKLTSQLCASFNADNYESVKRLSEGQQVERLGTTVQSIAMMIDNPFCSPAFNGGLLVIDESNSVASEFTGKTIKNEAATIATLKKAISKARTTLCLDAHIDSSTISMLESAGVNKADMLLIDVERPELEGYSINLFENELDEKGKSATKPALMNQIINELKQGQKIIVASLSASFLDSLERQVKKAGVFGSIKITGESKKEVFNSLNADTYGEYSLVMLSPAMSTGISFDKDNADKCYVLLSNNDGTGSYQDGLQAMLRDRNIKSKSITCIYEEGKQPLTSAEQVMIYKDRQLAAYQDFFNQNPELKKQFNQVRPASKKVDDFLWSEMVKQAREKMNFLPLFLNECKQKGATIKHCASSELMSGDITAETLASDKKAVELERVESILKADKIADDIDLDSDIDVKPMEARAKIEKFAAVDFDQINDTEKLELINKVAPADDKKSCIGRIRRMERSFTPTPMIKKQVEIAIIGARNDETDRVNFAEKITSKKIHWIEQARFTARALKSCGVVEDGALLDLETMPPLNESSAKSHPSFQSLYRTLQKAPEKAITSGMLGASIKLSEAKKIKASPFPYMITLINNLGIKLRKSRGLEQYIVDADSLQFDIDMINRRRAAGINESKEWLDRIDEYLKAHQARKAQAQKLDHAVVDTVPDSVSGAIAKALDKVEQIDLLHEAVKYLEPFHSRIENGGLSMINIELIVNRFVDSQI
jgi:hypothetical protein